MVLFCSFFKHITDLADQIPELFHCTDQIFNIIRIITLLSVLGVWLFATVFYIFFNIFAHANLWTLFCWAVPASFVVSIVFDAVWHKRRFLFLIISAFIWSLLLCFCLQFVNYNIWLILGIGVPLQLAVLLSAWLVKASPKEAEDGKAR